MLFYRPADGVAADFIPFYWEGQYHLFYLKDYRNKETHGEGTPWFHLVTRDFVTFEDWGEALPRGTKDEPDLYVFTGSVIAAPDGFHIFYTGHNPHYKDTGRPIETVLHATSPDLRTWTKDAKFSFPAPAGQGLEPHDWRDPFVYGKPGRYRMLLAARRDHGPKRLRGFTACAESANLRTWRYTGEFYAPDCYYTHECPDLFTLGKHTYLIFSEFSEGRLTRYRLDAEGRSGLISPPDDCFDAQGNYAAKTAGTRTRRHLFGWLPTRHEEKDSGGWQWGGNLVVHELWPRPDGSLAVRAPRTVLAACAQPRPLPCQPLLGLWRGRGHAYDVAAWDRHAVALFGEQPAAGLLELHLQLEHGSQAGGVILRAAPELESYYQVRLEPCRQRLVFDRWPRPGDQSFMLERPLFAHSGEPVTLRLLFDGTCLVVYANDEVALSTRLYDHRAGQWGLFVTEGEGHFRRVSLKVP